jgi:hypothetical protein
MNHKQRVILADAICAVRPDWNQSGVLSQLHILDSNWAGNDAQLAAHAMTVASSASAATPGAFNTERPATIPDPKPAGFDEPSCGICKRRKSECLRMHEREVRKGFPDPHEFESEEEAVTNRARSQLDARVGRHVGSGLPYVPEELSAEVAREGEQA